MESSSQRVAPNGVACVLGMHRSGTSVVSRLLGLLGADLGPDGSALDPNSDNPKGFWEHRSIVALNDDILSRFNGAWDRPPDFPDGWANLPALADLRQRARALIQSDFGRSPWWAWKDPRTCLTIPFWQQLLPPVDYVLCLRDPLGVAQSLHRRDGFTIEKGGRLWLTYTASALRWTSNRRRLLVFYEDVMRDCGGELERIASFLDRPVTAATRDQVREFLAEDLFHHRPSVTGSVDEPAVEFPAKSLYLTLRALYGSALSETGQSELESAVDLYSAHAIENHARTIEGREQVRTLFVERDLVREESAALREQLGHAERDIRVLMTERDVSNEHLRSARANWAERESQLLSQVEAAGRRAASEAAAQWTARFRERFRPMRARLAGGEAERSKTVRGMLKRFGRTAMSLELYRLPKTWSSAKTILALFRRPQQFREAHIITASGLFDPAYYVHRYPDVGSSRVPPLVHFAVTGAAEGRQPHPLFDLAWYRSRIAEELGTLNPLVHYIRWGAREGLDPHPLFSSAHYAQGLKGTPMIAGNPLIDYLTVGALEFRTTHALFDPVYYLEVNRDVRSSGVEPLSHFVVFGADENRRPNPLFDCEFYKRQVPEIAAARANPLIHFLEHGWRDRLNPSAEFDTSAYLLEHADVRYVGVNPLEHYMSHGRLEGRGIARVGSRGLPAGSPSSNTVSTPKALERRRDGEAEARAICRRFVLYASSLGNYFFHEIRDLLAAGLSELGFSVEIRDERQGFAPDADWHVVVAPHEFFYLGAGDELRHNATPRRLILFNTEQPSTQWFALARDCFHRAHAIWDISFESAQKITASGYRCSYLPLGYCAGFEAAREVAQLPDNYGTRSLPAQIKSKSFRNHSLAERPIDVFFVGHASPRRERFFAQCAKVLSTHRAYLHFSNVAAPVVPGQTTHMDTQTVMGLAQRSRILMNVHHGSDIYFEWHRIVLEGIWQRTLVVSEPCGVAPPFTPGLDFVEAPLDQMPPAIDYYLSTAEGREEAERIVEHGFRTLTEHCRLADALRRLILRLHDVPEFPDGFITGDQANRPQDQTGIDRVPAIS